MTWPAGAVVCGRLAAGRSAERVIAQLGATQQDPVRIIDRAMLAATLPVALAARAEGGEFWCRYFGRLAGSDPTTSEGLAQMLDAVPPTGAWILRSALDASAPKLHGWPMHFIVPTEQEVTPSLSRDWRTLIVARDHSDPSRHWAASKAVGARLSDLASIPTLPISIDPARETLTITRADVTPPGTPHVFSPVLDLLQLHASARSARQGLDGPGLADAFGAIREHSARPVEDTSFLLRWVLLAALIGDTHAHAGYIVLIRRDGRHGWRLAPLPPPALDPDSIRGESSYGRGWKIGTSWPDEHLRADHWAGLAADAAVRPRLVISMLQDFAAKVPAWTVAALRTFHSKPRSPAALHRGVSRMMIDTVERRCARAREILLTAPRAGIAGIASLVEQAQPGIAPPNETSEPSRHR